MPVNSFENYPMSWKPNKNELTSPVYQCLADVMERDIKNGELCANTKLPPQRELADYLDLNLTTITKAYKLCEMRGLIHAVVGKGTFVSPYANVPTSIVEKEHSAQIELAAIHPYYEHNKLIRDITIEILKKPFSEQLFESSYPLGNWNQLKAGAKWISDTGLQADIEHTMITSGVQNALSIILSSLFEAGDRIIVDLYTYPNFIGLANQLHLQLVPIESDSQGIRTDLLEHICSTQKIKGIYLMPSGNNPTNLPCSAARRHELICLIRNKNLIAIEDDNYAALFGEKLPPLAAELPEHCIFISGLSKPVCPGLRLAYLYTPSRFHNTLEQSSFNHNLKISSLSMEIAAELVHSGLAKQIADEKRNLSIMRNRIYNEYFPSERPYLETYCQWLILPEYCSGRLCEVALSHQGIHVFGAERFAVGNQAKCNAIRIATCSPTDEASLRQGLESIRQFIAGERENAHSYKM